MKSLLITLVALMVAASSYGVSMAQDSSSPGPGPRQGRGGGLREACGADMAKLCGDIDRSARRQCMADKFDQLSDGCKAAINAMRAGRQSNGGGGATDSK